METKEVYIKPDIYRVDKMTFPFDGIKHFINKQCQDCKTELCYRECIHFAALGCRQCSSCHGCR
jgi:hypothetical protein